MGKGQSSSVETAGTNEITSIFDIFNDI